MGQSMLYVCVALMRLPFSSSQGDSTLQYYLSRSELVLVGRIIAEPVGVRDADGVVNYSLDVEVSNILLGHVKSRGGFRVNAVCFQLGSEDRLPYLKKGAACIFFLKSDVPNKPEWKTADPWFGIQPYNSAMVESLKRMVKESAK